MKTQAQAKEQQLRNCVRLLTYLAILLRVDGDLNIHFLHISLQVNLTQSSHYLNRILCITQPDFTAINIPTDQLHTFI